jgi:hypothetical protein
MQGHDHRQGDGQKDTKKKRSGNQGGQHGERCHIQSSPTQDCVAPRRGQVHDFAQGADRPRPQCSSASRFTAGACGFLNLSQSGERPDRYRDPSRFETIPSSPILQACWKTVLVEAHTVCGVTRFRRDRYQCWSCICARQDGLPIGDRFGGAFFRHRNGRRPNAFYNCPMCILSGCVAGLISGATT